MFLSLHLCCVSSYCSEVLFQEKILSILVNKMYLHREDMIYVVTESRRRWLLILLSRRYLNGVDKVLSMCGIFLWNILCFFICVYWHMENKTKSAEILSKICWRWNLSLIKILNFFLIIFLKTECAKTRLHRKKA